MKEESENLMSSKKGEIKTSSNKTIQNVNRNITSTTLICFTLKNI